MGDILNFRNKDKQIYEYLCYKEGEIDFETACEWAAEEFDAPVEYVKAIWEKQGGR